MWGRIGRQVWSKSIASAEAEHKSLDQSRSGEHMKAAVVFAL